MVPKVANFNCKLSGESCSLQERIAEQRNRKSASSRGFFFLKKKSVGTGTAIFKLGTAGALHSHERGGSREHTNTVVVRLVEDVQGRHARRGQVAAACVQSDVCLCMRCAPPLSSLQHHGRTETVQDLGIALIALITSSPFRAGWESAALFGGCSTHPRRTASP